MDHKNKRKSSGPHRSATSLDNFLTPGVLFRFPSDCRDVKMAATFVSAFRPSVEKFINIEMHAFESFVSESSLKKDNSVFTDLNDSCVSSTRSISPFSATSNESDDLNDINQPSSKFNTFRKRKCESCGTRKTPYWRDGWESGVVLCNACGIRFHKYRRLCEKCKCIAKKDERGHLQCPKCFDKL